MKNNQILNDSMLELHRALSRSGAYLDIKQSNKMRLSVIKSKDGKHHISEFKDGKRVIKVTINKIA